MPVQIDRAGYLRSGVAAAGALIGALVAIPLGVLLVGFLFEHIGEPLMHGIASDSTEGRSGLEAVFSGIFGVIAGLMLALLVVVALAGPVFVLLPLAATATGLRLARAGLILRTLWLTLAIGVVIGLVGSALLDALAVPGAGWSWLLAVPLSAFLARLVVELWRPDRAALPDVAVVTGRGWRWAGIVLGALMLIVVVVVALFLLIASTATVTPG